MNELWTLRNTAFEKTISATTPRLADKDIVHNLILSRLPTLDQPLAKAAAHHFNSPGKMLRATMAMRGAHVLNVSLPAATRWAAAFANGCSSVGSLLRIRLCTMSLSDGRGVVALIVFSKAVFRNAHNSFIDCLR